MEIDIYPYVAEKQRSASELAGKPEVAQNLDAKSLQTIGLVALGFGGALLARYYAYIGFLPEIEWKEALTYLSVLSLSGAGLLAIYALLLFLPGVIWSEVLVNEVELEKLMSFERPSCSGRREPCPIGVTKAIGIPFGFFFLVAHVPILWGGEEIDVFKYGIVGLIPALGLLGLFLRRELKGHRAPKPLWSLLARYLSFFALSALLSLSSLLLIYHLLKIEMDAYPVLKMVLVCSLTVVVANLAVALQYRQWPTRAVTTAIVSAFILFVAGEAIPPPNQTLTIRIAALFGIGDSSEHTLLANKNGAELVAKLVGADSKAEAQIPHVKILSSLGRSYYLQIGNRKVVFPKDMVLAWVTTDPGAGGEGGGARLGAGASGPSRLAAQLHPLASGRRSAAR
jgi:hypothetical protein